MANLAVGSLLTASEYNADTFSSGDIKISAISTPQAGWVLCDGSSYPRTGGTYDALFAAIGTTYGNVDGSHFNVPDIQGRVPVGKGTNASVNALNANDGQAVANRRPQHRTTVTDPGHGHAISFPLDGANIYRNSGGSVGTETTDGSTAQIDANHRAIAASATTGITAGTGVANDALDTPSYIVLNYFIKL